MNNEEAIKTIQIAKADVEWNYPMEYQEAFDIAIECIEKQISKKFATNGENFGGMLYKFCPSCGHCMGLKPNASHCSECGQAFDCEVE